MFVATMTSPDLKSPRRRSLRGAPESVIVELRRTPVLADLAATSRRVRSLADAKVLPRLSGLSWDVSYPLVSLRATRTRRGPRNPADIAPPIEVDRRSAPQTFFARATTDDAGLLALRAAARNEGPVVGVSVDLPVRFCGQPAPDRTPASVETIRHLIGLDAMADDGLDGSGVWVAVVDCGISRKALEACGVTAVCDENRSWAASDMIRPFSFKGGHGTMCAFDVAIGAPGCVLLDFAAFRAYQPTGKETAHDGPLTAMLSDAVNAYSRLCELLLTELRAGRKRSLVVSNSWEVDSSRDFPADSPLNYGRNPEHAMNKVVNRLSSLGADIVFSAGNTTAAEREGTARPICGANAHPAVLTIAAVDVESRRLPISRPGPGTLTSEKPDVAAYSRFYGSGTMGSMPDDGTSAACALTAGVIAAIRSGFPHDPDRPETSPAALRSIVKKQARNVGSQGFDYDNGWGVLDGSAVAEALLSPPANFRPPARYQRPPAVALRPIK